MFGIMNGIAAYQGLIPYGGTFLNFLTYGWGAARLAALSRLRIIYVMTHDSIGLGEDGPTHQPIETLALTRATPNMLTFRPADGNETTGTYIVVIEKSDHPSVIALSRQNLPQLEGSSVEKVRKGGYVLQCPGKPDVIIASTGSEVCIAVDAAKKLESQGLKARIVSMPCTELFDEQPLSYKTEVFPTGIPIVSLEALSTFGWQRYSHAQVGMTTFGASAVSSRIHAIYVVCDYNSDMTWFSFSNTLMPMNISTLLLSIPPRSPKQLSKSTRRLVTFPSSHSARSKKLLS
jgi:transketolase